MMRFQDSKTPLLRSLYSYVPFSTRSVFYSFWMFCSIFPSFRSIFQRCNSIFTHSGDSALMAYYFCFIFSLIPFLENFWSEGQKKQQKFILFDIPKIQRFFRFIFHIFGLVWKDLRFDPNHDLDQMIAFLEYFEYDEDLKWMISCNGH